MATRNRLKSTLRAEHMPSQFRHLDGKFQSQRGPNLSYLGLFPSIETPLRGVVLYLHGIGDHSRRYFHLYERLCNRGFGVLAYDLLSHGSSDSDYHGLRAHSAKFHYFVDDTNEFITMAKTQLYPQLGISTSSNEPKLILSGISYGTLVGLYTILSGKHAFSGVVLVAPALLVEMTTTLKVQAFFARPLSRIIPKARIVPGVNRDYICRDQNYLDDFKADPLTVLEPITARMGAETLKAMRALEVDKRVEDKTSVMCKLPMLMMMGSNDKVTSLELAQEFYKRLASSEKEFKVFDGYFHALFDDPEHEVVFDFLDNWLKTKFPLPEEANMVDTIDGEEMITTIKSEVIKNDTADVPTAVKEKKAEKVCVMEVAGDAVDATNTSLVMEAKVEIVQTPEDEKGSEGIASLTDETKHKAVDFVKAKAEILETIVVTPEVLEIGVIQEGIQH